MDKIRTIETELAAEDAPQLERLADAAETFAECARVHLARIEWNQSHDDADGFDPSKWHNRTVSSQGILRKLLNGESLNAFDATILNNDIARSK